RHLRRVARSRALDKMGGSLVDRAERALGPDLCAQALARAARRRRLSLLLRGRRPGTRDRGGDFEGDEMKPTAKLADRTKGRSAGFALLALLAANVSSVFAGSRALIDTTQSPHAKMYLPDLGDVK